jgi:hypothetical protein
MTQPTYSNSAPSFVRLHRNPTAAWLREHGPNSTHPLPLDVFVNPAHIMRVQPTWDVRAPSQYVDPSNTPPTQVEGASMQVTEITLSNGVTMHVTETPDLINELMRIEAYVQELTAALGDFPSSTVWRNEDRRHFEEYCRAHAVGASEAAWNVWQAAIDDVRRTHAYSPTNEDIEAGFNHWLRNGNIAASGTVLAQDLQLAWHSAITWLRRKGSR